MRGWVPLHKLGRYEGHGDELDERDACSVDALAFAPFLEAQVMLEKQAGLGETRHETAARSVPRAQGAMLKEPTGRNLRSRSAISQLLVVIPQPYTPEDLRQAVQANVPAIFNIDKLEHLKDYFREKLADHTLRYPTTTRTMATFKEVFEDLNGTLRIEDGIHPPSWEEGSASSIVEMLCTSDSLMTKAWETVKKYVIEDPVEVMICSGDSTRMVQRIENNGGVTVSRKRQTVVCHYDDIHNFTFLIYGRKTFLLASPQDVPYGPNQERNVNRSVDTSSSVFRKAVIEPGQLLYLPKDWWHEVPFAYSDTYASFSTS